MLISWLLLKMLNVKQGTKPPCALSRFRCTRGRLCFWIKFPTPHITLSCPLRSSHKHLLSVSPKPHVFVQSLKCKLHESRKRICFIHCFTRARTVPWTSYMVGLNKLCYMNKQINGGPKEGIKGLKRGSQLKLTTQPFPKSFSSLCAFWIFYFPT